MNETDRNLLAQTCAQCVQCGACRAICPVHGLSRKEEHSPRGKLKLYQAMLNGQIKPSGAALSALRQCLLCGRCQKSCPSKLKVTDALKAGRALLASKNPTPARLLGRVLLSSRLPRLLALAWPFKRALRQGLALRLKPLKRLPALRVNPPSLSPVPGAGPRIGLFLGCMATYARPGLAEKAISILRQEGAVLPLGGCCGLAAQSAGQAELMGRAAQGLAAACSALKLDYIVTLCTSCAHALSQEYPKVLPQRSPSIPLTIDINQFLGERLHLLKGRAATARVRLHHSCHLEPGQAKALHTWLEHVGVKLSLVDACCGGGGMLPFNHPFLSQRITPVLADDGLPVVTTCSGCYLQWLQSNAGQVLHPIELLAYV